MEDSIVFLLLNYFKEKQDLQQVWPPLGWKHQGFGIQPSPRAGTSLTWSQLSRKWAPGR